MIETTSPSSRSEQFLTIVRGRTRASESSEAMRLVTSPMMPCKGERSS